MPGDDIITIYLCCWLAVLGAVLGSFLDCAAGRWAAGERWITGRSRCAACGRTLGPAELVPVLSFLILRGRCRGCGAKIPADCLLAELAGAAGLACLGLRFGPSGELGMWLVFGALLLAVSLTDLKKRLIPDRLLLPAAANRAVWLFVLGQPPGETVRAMLPGLLVCAGLLGLVLALERLLGREAMGGGDIKLLAVLALYLSWAQLLLALLAGCVLGVAAAALGRRREGIPFGPCLAAGCVLTVCFGGGLIEWYLGLVSV